jgi:signal transduction histidine kinase
MRDTKEIFSALKDNVDQLMSKLQDGLMLFTRDSRVVLVSAPVERFLGRPRGELLGRTAGEIFSRDSASGIDGARCFRAQASALATRVHRGRWPARPGVSMDFVQEKGTQIGALLIMRDAESVRRIGDEIEMSRRLSASGRVTGGVAHEVKNPINAIVLHLQLLQNKLSNWIPTPAATWTSSAARSRGSIGWCKPWSTSCVPASCIWWKSTFRRLLDEVALLAAPDAEQHGVKISAKFGSGAVAIKADLDLMKQALLNVVLNGVQAMPEGGPLTISAHRDGNAVIAEIRDRGIGIPQDMHEKVFELYFTTKKDGNGIGLAQTYQILHWHHGSVEFQSSGRRGYNLPLPHSSG